MIPPEEWDARAKQSWEANAGDPIRTADALFATLVPAGCTKKDYKTIARGDAFFDGWNLSMIYAGIVSGALEVNIDMDDESAFQQGRRVMDRISTWYSQLTGEPLPDID